MRIVLALAISLIACTKQNPNLCCIDEADCANVGLEETKGCDDGLLCRGNQCIAEVCATSDECDAAAPYCIAPPEGRCQPSCSEDSECPGFGESSSQTFCEQGACIECRDDSVCAGTTPTCDTGTCVACVRNDQCASGVCVADGSCAAPTQVAYVATTGSATGECTEASPCSKIEFALALTPPRQFVVVESGTYTRSTSLTLNGERRIIGRGASLPLITRSTQGPVVTAVSGILSLERLEIFGGVGDQGDTATSGHGVLCLQGGGSDLSVIDSVLRNNQGHGLQGRMCIVRSSHSKFINNASNGIRLADSTATIDGCQFSGNGFTGGTFDGGVYKVTNSFFTRNTNRGLDLFANGGTQIEFNTIVDNGTGPNDEGFLCQSAVGTLACPNNLIARNKKQTTTAACTFPNSLTIETDIAPLKFVSPNAAPFDYHLQAGSIAIDAAVSTTVDHDVDGDPRPSSGADIGADEF